MQTTLTIPHSSQFLGEMDLCYLNFLLLILRVLHHLHCSRLLSLCPLRLPLPLPQLPSLNQFPLIHNIKGSPEMSGYQNNGQLPCATGRSESPLQSFPLLPLMNPLMIHLIVFSPPLYPSPQLTNSHSCLRTRIHGTRLVRRRWRLIG